MILAKLRPRNFRTAPACRRRQSPATALAPLLHRQIRYRAIEGVHQGQPIGVSSISLRDTQTPFALVAAGRSVVVVPGEAGGYGEPFSASGTKGGRHLHFKAFAFGSNWVLIIIAMWGHRQGGPGLYGEGKRREALPLWGIRHGSVK